MPWDQRRDSRPDPQITSGDWRILRRQWKARGLPCARCGRAIDYTTGRFLASGKINPRSFVLGHKVSRREARALGWSEAMINDSSNLQAECQKCSNRSGAQLGRALQPPTNGWHGDRRSFRAPAPVDDQWIRAKARWDEWEAWAIKTYGVVKDPPSRW
jgi:hypothetical protein